jgi:uridine kinase
MKRFDWRGNVPKSEYNLSINDGSVSMNKAKPLVIAIAAVSGGGKTTITSRLEETLQNSAALFFDDYDFDGPTDMMDWIEQGSNPDEWDLSPLISDIGKLSSEPLEYLLLDYPFAYTHRQTRNLVDVAVFIDTPLDIAMARRITRDHKSGSASEVLENLENYLDKGRQGYFAMLDSIKPTADLIVDGALSVSRIVRIISEHIAEFARTSAVKRDSIE